MNKRRHFAGAALRQFDSGGQFVVVLRPYKIAIAPDADAQARLGRLDLAARRAPPDRGPFVFRDHRVSRRYRPMVEGPDQRARALLEAAIGALVIRVFFSERGDLPNDGFKAPRLYVDRPEMLQKIRVVLGSHDVKLLIGAAPGALFDAPHCATTNAAPQGQAIRQITFRQSCGAGIDEGHFVQFTMRIGCAMLRYKVDLHDRLSI